MTEIKEGWKTSEFRYGALIATFTTFGEQLGIFDVSAFENDPILMLIYRGIQLIVIGATAVYYINGRSGVKREEQVAAPIIFENKTSREG